MGDRGNIFIKEKDSGIYFYSHWSGSDLPIILKKALIKGEDRWSDLSYLARIIFCTMTEGDDTNIGFGISISPEDNEYPLLVVDSEENMVHISDFPYNGKHKYSISFKKYIELKENECCAVRDGLGVFI